MKRQTLFNILDGMLMVSPSVLGQGSKRLANQPIQQALAVWIFNIVHPGFFLPRHDRIQSNHA
jgi:hypothetical protein